MKYQLYCQHHMHSLLSNVDDSVLHALFSEPHACVVIVENKESQSKFFQVRI